MFESFDVESGRKASQAMSSQARPSPMGFSFPGFSSSIECNEHPKMPDEPRIEELRKVSLAMKCILWVCTIGKVALPSPSD